jgi:hypothetical protein
MNSQRICALLLHASAAIPTTKDCRNPLFETHWFSKAGQVSSLADEPRLHSDLMLCPAYNGVLSCCQETFETEQSLHFNYWKEVLSSKIERIRGNRAGTLAMQKQAVYNAASEQDRELHKRALEMYDVILSPSKHARCFAAMLTYVAGVICFSCEARWENKILFHKGVLINVRLTESTCSEVATQCEDFSQLTAQWQQAVLDSVLATAQSTPLENLGMFVDQQSLCDWLHDAIALHPFTTPNEPEREAAPPREAIGARRLDGQNSNTSASGKNGSDGDTNASDVEMTSTTTSKMDTEEQLYDAMKAGRASGFDISWPGLEGSNDAAHVFSSASQLFLVVAVAWTNVC